MNHDATHHDRSHEGGFFSLRWNIGLVVFLAIAGFYLLSEHQAHLFGVLPFLLVLACPLMHVFMHGGHGGHGGHGSGARDDSDPSRSSSDRRP